jgi:hypothetical protein
MKINRMVVVLLALLTTMAFADPPTTSDSRPHGNQFGRPPHGPPFRGGPESAAELQSAWEMVRQYSPNRWAAYQQVQAHLDAEQKAALDRGVLWRYRQMQWMFRDDDLREIKLKQLQIEDEIFGVRMKMNQPAADMPALKEQLQSKVRDLVDSRMREREIHIARLQDMLKNEQERLAKDRERKDELVASKVEEELKNEPNNILPDRPRRGPDDLGPPPARREPKPGPGGPP